MILHANCKINLGLDVVRRRDDGFHELCTVMIPVRELYDIVGVDLTDDEGVQFECSGLVVDCNVDDNLCVKAARLVLERYGRANQGVRISLDKRVPFGAGLGGGSSDATAVIIALNRLLGLGLMEEELIDLAAELGSDTAFFVRNTPQYCTGRGEIMRPMPEAFCRIIESMRIELIKPEGINISTREAYAGITAQEPSTSLWELLQQPVDSWQGRVKNDFERAIFASYPILQDIKDDFLKRGAIYSAMSGSGSTIFALFAQE